MLCCSMQLFAAVAAKYAQTPISQQKWHSSKNLRYAALNRHNAQFVSPLSVMGDGTSRLTGTSTRTVPSISLRQCFYFDNYEVVVYVIGSQLYGPEALNRHQAMPSTYALNTSLAKRVQCVLKTAGRSPDEKSPPLICRDAVTTIIAPAGWLHALFFRLLCSTNRCFTPSCRGIYHHYGHPTLNQFCMASRQRLERALWHAVVPMAG